MEIYKKILTCSDKKLNKIIQDRIDQLTEAAIEENGDDVSTIGYYPIKLSLSENPTGEEYYEEISFWIGYIPLGMKMAYKIDTDEHNKFTDTGGYSIMDSEEYVFEFARYLRSKKIVISDPHELLDHVNTFLDMYFGTYSLTEITRKEMHTLLVDKNGNYITPINEHNISSFRSTGAAMCTEYSALSANILSVFGFNTIYVSGSFDKEGHNYTLISYGEDCGVLDLSYPVEVFSIEGDFLRYVPYYGVINLNDDEFDEFLAGERKVELEDYCFIEMNGHLHKSIIQEEKRTYSVDGEEIEEEPPKVLII